ncbi:MAG: hypothetical protein ACYCO3_07170 [Mycobacteriales bacterium]
MSGPIVDTETAREFMREIHDRAEPAQLAQVAEDLQRKSTALQDLLIGSTPDRAALRRALRWIFCTRRRADRLLEEIGYERLAEGVRDLLDASADLAERFNRFDRLLAQLDDPPLDLPGELLHFCRPEQYWLWSRWMWDPRTETGALALVTTDEVTIAGATRGQTYLQVGHAVAFVDETGKAAQFTTAGPGLFGLDVFLAAVYGVYMYTVLRMRMTQEFTRLVPQLPDLVRRLLGVYHMEE